MNRTSFHMAIAAPAFLLGACSTPGGPEFSHMLEDGCMKTLSQGQTLDAANFSDEVVRGRVSGQDASVVYLYGYYFPHTANNFRTEAGETGCVVREGDFDEFAQSAEASFKQSEPEWEYVASTELPRYADVAIYCVKQTDRHIRALVAEPKPDANFHGLVSLEPVGTDACTPESAASYITEFEDLRAPHDAACIAAGVDAMECSQN